MRKVFSYLSLSLAALLLHLSAFTVYGADADKYKIPRLSPIPDNMSGDSISLAGQWKFDPSADENFTGMELNDDMASINVPGEWVMQGFDVKPGDKAGYVRTVSIPKEWRGRRIKLRCNAIYSFAELVINGHIAGNHLGGFTAFETDVTDYIDFGNDNTIAILVTNESLANSTSNGSFYAVHQLGGITRDIVLISLPPVNVAMFHTSTVFRDTTYTDASLMAEVTVANEMLQDARNLSLRFTLRDRKGEPVVLSEPNIRLGSIASKKEYDIKACFDVKAPEKWDAEHPYLYTLVCELLDNGKRLTSVSRKVGFRQVEIDGNRVLLNGTALKLRGVCRHETSPDRGRSLTGDIWRRDVDIFRQGNVNYIRTSHYPPDEALLDASDELGMFVEVEAPLCWSHQTDVPAEKHYDIYVRQHLEMLNAYRSHPSVIIWSLGNESVNFHDYKEAAEAVKAIDTTRPRNFSQWGPAADEGMLEIANHHYPGPGGPEKYRDYPRPIVFDEFCHLNAYNRLELAADPGLRDMWGEMLDRMWTGMYNSTGVLGGAIWVGIDDTFFLPDGRTVGYGTWGTIDGWRREKPEYWGMKKAYSPVRISLDEHGFEGNVVKLNVENRHLFTNLDECVIDWKYGNSSGKARPSLSPGAKSTVDIELPVSVNDTTSLEISVIGARGFEIDRYIFNSAVPLTAQEKFGNESVGLESDSDNSVIIDFGGKTVTIDKMTGNLTVQKGDLNILTSAPRLMVLPLNGEGEGIQMTGREQTFTPYNPVCTEWKVSDISSSESGGEVEIIVNGEYREAEGSFTYRFSHDGMMRVDYSFVMLDSISPRQTGVVFSAPKDFNTVNWSRDGYWNAYPDNHIGALEGMAKAYSCELPVSGIAGPAKRPSWDWSLDQTVNGSNIFRSTKRNIRRASLSTDDGSSRINIVSDGTQHLRPWIDNDITFFLVADYTNGGRDTYLVSHAEADYRPLCPGDKVEGSVSLSFD